jgi:hypothetical protein
MDRKLEVRERMKKRYAFKNYPDEFNYRCKCFVVFQNLDGVDVVLFGLYVYEHDEKNPPPNKRAVYVSYLDSVHYMRPRSMRTFIYHEILISYLDYVRRRGFATAHIWACPPLKGDDYILYAKPEDQKTPKDDRLRAWYIDMLVECQKRGVVGKVTNMYDLYFSNKSNDAAVVPYMEGDYFPAEVENIIKDIEEGKPGKKSSGKEGKKKKGDKKQKKKSGRSGTRSSGIDEDALKASGVQFPVDDQRSLEEGGRDIVMAKLGETIQPMKESFIVAFLAWKGAKEEDMVVPKEIQEYRDQHNITIDFEPDDDDANDNAEAAKPSEETNLAEQKFQADQCAPNEIEKDGAEEETADRVMVKEESSTNAPNDSKDVLDDAKMDVDNVSTDDKSLKSKEDGEDKATTNADDLEMNDSVKRDKDEESSSPKKEIKENVDDSEKKEDGGDSTSNDNAKDDSEQNETVTGNLKEEEIANGNVEKKAEADSDARTNDDCEKSVSHDGNEDSKLEERKDQSNQVDVKMEDAPKDAADSNSDSMDNEKNDGSADNDSKAPEKEQYGENDKEGPPSSGGSTGSLAAKSDSPEKADGDMSEEKKDETKPESSSMDVDALPDASNGSTPNGSNPDNDVAGMSEDAAPAPAPTSNSAVAPAGDSSGALSDNSARSKLSMEERSGKFAAMAKKRGIPGAGDEKAEKEEEKKEPEKEEEKAVPAVYVLDSKGRRVKVIDDDAEELDCEFLNNRQAFLNLCQGNHYQFDQLRRAKHSSMMVLWHLHNRDAPKFVQQCTTCSREILQGYRFHCPTCADFDQCQDCFQNPNSPRHPHQLKPIPVSGQQTELTEAQRKERQRSIQLHMTLLLHAATCVSQKCPSANCTKMKGLLKHGAQCQQKTTGGCNVCKRIWALLQIHARQCKAQPCPVPNCMAIRERVRQLKKQQQAMDDRRRQEMNRVYRGAR